MNVESPAIHDPAVAHARLAALRRELPLPSGAELSDVFVEQATLGELCLSMVGLVAHVGAETITGSAADRAGFPVERAYFELVERVSLFTARAGGRMLALRDAKGVALELRSSARVFGRPREQATRVRSLSNGVAVQKSWAASCEAALAELVERDRVLRSFAGEQAPEAIATDRALASALRAHYAIESYAFTPRGARHQVAGVFLFPRWQEAPLCVGFGAATERSSAVERAAREALQRLAFLWGEALPQVPPAIDATADGHQEYYLYPPHRAALRAWLMGERRDGTRACTTAPFDGEQTRFVDLTPPELAGALYVAKAVSPRARQLRFGWRVGVVPHPIA